MFGCFDKIHRLSCGKFTKAQECSQSTHKVFSGEWEGADEWLWHDNTRMLECLGCLFRLAAERQGLFRLNMLVLVWVCSFTAALQGAKQKMCLKLLEPHSRYGGKIFGNRLGVF